MIKEFTTYYKRLMQNSFFVGLTFYLRNILIWIDQGVNTLLLGDPDETISRRAGRACKKERVWGCVLCKLLDLIDPRHCSKAIDNDGSEEGKNSVPQMLKRWRLDKDTIDNG